MNWQRTFPNDAEALEKDIFRPKFPKVQEATFRFRFAMRDGRTSQIRVTFAYSKAKRNNRNEIMQREMNQSSWEPAENEFAN